MLELPTVENNLKVAVVAFPMCWNNARKHDLPDSISLFYLEILCYFSTTDTVCWVNRVSRVSNSLQLGVTY